jgi:hypothetical protein
MSQPNLQNFVKEGTPWDDIPNKIKSVLGSKEVYENTLKKYSFDQELSFEESPCKFMQKSKYYTELVNYDKSKLKVIL